MCIRDSPEDYVSYPIALALKKAGFDLAVNHYYDEKGDLVESLADYNNEDSFNSQETAYDDFNHGYCDEISCSAPTLAQAQKWLREKGIHISVNPYMGYDVDADGALYNEYPSWGFELMDVASADFMNDAGGNHTSYESALSAGIAAALELVEKKGE